MTLRIEAFCGNDIRPLISDIARLRISVFREWPYLYDGDDAYEERYLEQFASGHSSVVVAVFEGTRVVGVATGAALGDHTDVFGGLFEAHGIAARSVYYFGESALLQPYRGRGLGHAFFDDREAHVGRLVADGAAFRRIAFCAVVRGQDDPRQTAGYRPLDSFWSKRGFSPVEGLIGSYEWREIGQSHATDHPMQFWMRDIEPNATC